MLPPPPQALNLTLAQVLRPKYALSDDDQCMDQLIANKQIVALYSGKSITQMGLYDDCINTDQFKYGLLQVVSKATHLPIGVEMGLCIPVVCQPKFIEDYANQALAELGQTTFYTELVENPQQFFPAFGASFYITTILLGLFALLVVIATAFRKLSKKNHVIGAFDLVKNMSIFEYKEHKFNVFNGIKALCMMWVILGHMYSVRIQNVVNVLTIKDQVEGPFFLLVLAAFFAVDVFFYMGGFLVAYSFLRNNMKSMLKYPLAILHRLLRFWPSYIMAMLIYYSLVIHAGAGPLWWKLQTAGQISYCQSMWKAVFFVDNIVDNGEQMCMGWGWYLQNDMQIFIVSIPILLLYNTKRKMSFYLIGVLMVLSLILNFIEVQTNQYITVAHRADFAKWNSYFPNVYIKPWTRCTPYLYGLLLGLLYMEHIEEEKQKKEVKGFFSLYKQKLENSRMFKNITQLGGLCILIFIVVIPRTLQLGHTWPQTVHSIYLTFTKLFFVIGVSLLATPSLLGIKDDFFFWLMDTKIANTIAKISFWTYLIHYMIVQYSCFIQKVDYYYDVGDVLSLYFPVALISMLFGLIGTMLIENPFAKLEKMLFEGKKKSHKSKEDKQPYKGQDLINDSVVSGSSISSTGDLKSSSLAQSLLNKSVEPS